MPPITLVAHRLLPDQEDRPAITDLAFATAPGGAETLYATTRYSGVLEAWSLEGGGLQRLASVAHGRPDAAGSEPQIAFVATGSGLAALTGGGHDGALSLRPLRADGSFASRQTLGTPEALAGDLAEAVTVTLGSGAQVVYGAMTGADGIARLTFDAAGALLGATRILGGGEVHSGRVAAVATVEAGGRTWLLTAGTALDGGGPGVTAWAVSSTGGLAAADGVGQGDGLWIGAPTALAAGEAFGRGYVVLASAASSSLSVIEVGPEGSLRVTDQVLDSLDTRFGGVTALETVTAQGQTWVLAGGADDGLSLFRILPGGRLLHSATIADGAGTGLADVSAIAARIAAGRLDILAASATEPGLTRLAYDIGGGGRTVTAAPGGAAVAGTAAGDLLVGAAGADRLDGGAGDDVLMDGAGADRLTGGAGADVFVLTMDGEADVVADFRLGVDRLDLSNWEGLRNIGQLAMTATATGLRIAYRDEVLLVEAGGRLDPARLGPSDLLSLMRVWTEEPNDPGDVVGTDAGDRMVGTAAADRLFGRGGADVLDGAGGGDLLAGGTGDDGYYVRAAADRIEEGAGGGYDRLWASVSYALGAGVHVETMATTAAAGTSAIDLTGNALRQAITGNAGANTLSTGGGAADVLRGLGGDDTYRVYNAADQVIEAAGQGRDRVAAAVDYVLAAGVPVEVLATNGATGRAAIDLTGNELAQAIIGNAGANRLSDGGGAGDVLSGGAGDDTYVLRSAASRVIEAAGGGFDRVAVAMSHALSAGAEVEWMTTTASAGTAPIALTGNELAQTILGNAGSNRLDGGLGRDTLTGGAGADWFVFSAAPGASGWDLVTDFEDGRDRIVLDDAAFAGLRPGDLAASAFAASAGGLARDALDRVLYDSATGYLYWDADGSGAGARTAFARLDPGLTLDAADILVI